MSRKSSTCGLVASVIGVAVFLLCGGVLGVGALVGMNSPRPTTPVQTDADRLKQASEEFVAISEIKDEQERAKRLREWEAKYPDLMDNFRRNMQGK